jgi:hypothetical protein
MSVVPSKQVEKIQFFETHISPWTTNAVAIGTTTTAVTDLDNKTQAARDAFTAQQAAQAAAKAATNTLNNAIIAMDIAGQGIIKQIRAKAEVTANPDVYSLAQIPAPATPSPVGAPGTPTEFGVQLSQDGSLELSWKCSNPVGCTGVVYQVWRRVGADGEFSYCGGAGERKFTDNTIPAGSSQVTYQIQAVRSTGAGPWAQYNVNFGVGGGETMTVTKGKPAKIAA